MRKAPRRWALIWCAVCALPFAAMPPLLAVLPLDYTVSGLWLLVWPACPVLALAAGFGAARRGVPAALAWLFAPAAYLLLPLWGIRPEWPVLLASCVLGVFSAVAAEQWALLNAKQGKKNANPKKKRRR